MMLRLTDTRGIRKWVCSDRMWGRGNKYGLHSEDSFKGGQPPQTPPRLASLEDVFEINTLYGTPRWLLVERGAWGFGVHRSKEVVALDALYSRTHSSVALVASQPLDHTAESGGSRPRSRGARELPTGPGA